MSAFCFGRNTLYRPCPGGVSPLSFRSRSRRGAVFLPKEPVMTRKRLGQPPEQGCNQSIAIKWAKKAGCKFKNVNRTGDAEMWHDDFPEVKSCRFSNHSHKDAQRHLTGWLKDLHKLIMAAELV